MANKDYYNPIDYNIGGETKMKYVYYTAFLSDTDVGSTVIQTTKKVNTCEELNIIEEHIKRKLNIKKVVILNIIRLKNYSKIVERKTDENSNI